MAKERSRIAGLGVCCAVVLALGAPQALATPLVEVTVETDKAVYDLGETCIITCTLYNPTDEWAFLDANNGAVQMYAFDNAAHWDRLYLLANEEPLWYAPMFLITFGPFLVRSGQSYQQDLNWYFPLDAAFLGEYELVAITGPADGVTMIDLTNASAHITVVPEPVTLALVVAGVGALIARRPKRRRLPVVGNAWPEP